MQHLFVIIIFICSRMYHFVLDLKCFANGNPLFRGQDITLARQAEKALFGLIFVNFPFNPRMFEGVGYFPTLLLHTEPGKCHPTIPLYFLFFATFFRQNFFASKFVLVDANLRQYRAKAKGRLRFPSAEDRAESISR